MTNPAEFTLATIDLPEFELPREKPTIPASTFVARLEAVQAAMQSRGLDALVVYGDREHFANTTFLTGFDPRYEESLYLLVPGRTPRILVGNENVGYAHITPYPIDIIRQSKLSLPGQPDPDDISLADQLRDAGIAGRVGLVGWKLFRGAGTEDYFDVPHFVVTEVAKLAESIVNATDLFQGPGGVRLDNDEHQIAYYEFAAGHGSSAMRRLISGIEPGMTELEASALMAPIQLPLNYHPTMLGGYTNAGYGVASAGGRILEEGDPVAAGIGYWGSNIARAGFLVRGAEDLPAEAHDWVEKIVLPYYATAAAWYETIRIGLTAGELYDVTASRLGDPFYGIFLNPGHFIGLDEWPYSPVEPGNTTVFVSGNAIQLDIIPMPGGPYHTAQIEDGIVLADEDLRGRIQAAYPGAWARIQQRRDMLQNVFGITLHPEVLPMSNTAGYFPPFWLAPNVAVVRN